MTADTAPATAPKSTRVTAPPRADRKPRTGRKKSLKTPLKTLFTSFGTTVAMFNRTDGIIIVAEADNLADALNNLAKDNDVVYRNLERMLTGSAWGSVFVAAGAIILPIAANHNLLPFQIPGVTIPEPADIETGPIPDIGQNVSSL